jgi:predicted nucleic acid-binding protein
MNVFLDTNILLDLYQLSGPDLDELKKLIKLAENRKIKIYITTQIEDEFWRNREGVLQESIKHFKETKAITKIPNIVRSYSEKAIDLKQAADKVNELVKEITKIVDQDSKSNQLKADSIINELFSKIKPEPFTNDIFLKAKRRKELGNPPGKANSIGDAVNWEWLLTVVPANSTLILLSADGDFESELLNGAPKEFLQREWLATNGGNLELYKNLPDFLRKYFPEIKLSDEIDKATAIERLERSSNFTVTHRAIAKLMQYDDFKDIEVIRILRAYTTNNQISWILGDEDVFSFALKILKFSKSDEAQALANNLTDMLDEIIQSKEPDIDIEPF